MLGLMTQPKYQIRSKHHIDASADRSYIHRMGTDLSEEEIDLSVLMESKMSTASESDPSLRLSPLDSNRQPPLLAPDLSLPCFECEDNSAIETVSVGVLPPARKLVPIEPPILESPILEPPVLEPRINKSFNPLSYLKAPKATDRIQRISLTQTLTYTKGLEHDSTGAVPQTSLDQFQTELEDSFSTLSHFKRVLISSNLISESVPDFPLLDSDAMGAQMATLYAMSLVRDLPFNQWVGNKIIRDVCRDLNQFKARPLIKGPHLPQNLFRCSKRMLGPYISQFLFRSESLQPQTYVTGLEDQDFMGTWSKALAGVNSTVVRLKEDLCRTVPRTILTGRDLAWIVRCDSGLPLLRQAHQLLVAWKIPLNYEASWLDRELILAVVVQKALGVADSIKWNRLAPRPEEYGLQIERGYRIGTISSVVSSDLLSNQLLTTIQSRQHNHLLTQVYPQGAPYSPSYPSSTAVIAGAGVTILKFFYSTSTSLPIYEPSSDGLSLVLTSKQSSVGEELDQLGFNLGLGRCWAGVNYPIDVIEGLKLGERVALRYLQKKLGRLNPIKIQQFNGRSIWIGTGVTLVKNDKLDVS